MSTITGFSRCRPALGTYVRVTIRDQLPDAQRLDAIAAAFAAVADVDAAMSFHREDSDLSRINTAAAGSVLELHAGLVEVLGFARELHELSDGVFDPGVADRLVEWGLLPRRRGVATSLSTILDVEFLNATRIRVRRATCLDLGGIAKGYAVDRAIAALGERGIAQAEVEAGGDLRVLGDARPIHVRLPGRSPTLRPLGELGDGAVASSALENRTGMPLRFAFVDGRTRAPVLDPRVFSVVATECMAADALTKVLAATGRLPAGAARWHAQAIVS